MRSLTETLKAAQRAESIDALIKIVLTHGASSYTYTRDRILDINHPEEPYSQRAKLVLDNSDKALNDIDLKGYKGVLSKGAITSAGEEYSATAPLWVIAQTFNSSPDVLDCVLSLVGIMNLMAEDKASESYMPSQDDTKTVKTLINQIVGATLACYSHCQAYEVVWEVGYDSLADTYKPKDSFRIYVGGSRLASFRRLLDYTGNVARVEADGKWHIFKPKTTGSVYDYEYSLESGHTFFSKAYRKTLVIPNRIVVKSQPDDDPQYSGSAQIDGYDDLPEAVKKTDYKQMRLGVDQADDIATAILSKHQLWSEMGAADVPMNVGAEIFDYVKVTDEREEDYRIGNLGHLTRHYNAKRAEWRMTFSFGNWMTVRKALANLDPSGSIGTDELEEYFTRLMVKDLYVENILAENMNFVWIDPDNTIDLSKIGDNLDNLPDGEVYARVKTLHLDAGQVKLDENILYKAGYNPTEKMPGDADLDNIPDGAVYQRAKSAALTADGLVILDQVIVGTYGLVKSAYISAGRILLEACEGDIDDIDEGSIYGKVKRTSISAGKILLDEVVEDTYGLVKSTDISAGHIVLSECRGDLDDIDEGSIYGRVRKTDISAGHIKLYIDQNLDEQGVEIISDLLKKIRISADGITITGTESLCFKWSTKRSYIYQSPGGNLCLSPYGAIHLLGEVWMQDHYPFVHEYYDCGASDGAWKQVVGEFVYSSDGAIHSYQKHDDIALLKAIKPKWVAKGKYKIDGKTLPQDMVVKNKRGQNYVNIAGLSGFNIGIQKALLKRIEALEATKI